MNDINIFLFLFADDAVLFSKSPDSLQSMLDKLQEYSSFGTFMIKKKKTKIMIFEKGKTASKRFYYDSYELELVELFKYLGVIFYKNGNFYRTQKCIAEYGTYSLE